MHLVKWIRWRKKIGILYFFHCSHHKPQKQLCTCDDGNKSGIINRTNTFRKFVNKYKDIKWEKLIILFKFVESLTSLCVCLYFYRCVLDMHRVFNSKYLLVHVYLYSCFFYSILVFGRFVLHLQSFQMFHSYALHFIYHYCYHFSFLFLFFRFEDFWSSSWFDFTNPSVWDINNVDWKSKT